jgi:hypothetical protein
MSFTADEYYNINLALGGAENNAIFSCTARTYTMRFPNGRHPSVNVLRVLTND